MDIQEERVVHPIELDRLARRSFDHPGMSKHFRRIAADVVDAVELPDNRLGTSRQSGLGGKQKKRGSHLARIHRISYCLLCAMSAAMASRNASTNGLPPCR